MQGGLDKHGPPVRLRRFTADELDWINARYREVDFVASSADELIAVAEVGGVSAGIGRVVPVADGVGELGGMLVFDAFRGSGVAKAIIAYLVAQSCCDTLYCLPFADLRALYAAAGFMQLEDFTGVPSKVAAKHQWCNTHYPAPVLLMRRSKQ